MCAPAYLISRGPLDLRELSRAPIFWRQGLFARLHGARGGGCISSSTTRTTRRTATTFATHEPARPRASKKAAADVEALIADRRSARSTTEFLQRHPKTQATTHVSNWTAIGDQPVDRAGGSIAASALHPPGRYHSGCMSGSKPCSASQTRRCKDRHDGEYPQTSLARGYRSRDGHRDCRGRFETRCSRAARRR